MILRLASTFVLALGMAVFANSAFAGNGNGNGSGNADGVVPSAAVEGDSSHGKSEAPGQTKKEAEAGQPAPVEAGVVVEEESPANSEGVKPSNTTTTEHETHAAASSDKTKKYGNGKTAGQIAIQNGAAPTAILHGPGNSQPHKVAPCTGGDEVDVHALKSKGHRKACGAPSEGPKPGPAPGSNTNRSSDQSPSTSDPLGGSASVADPGTSPPTGGVSPSSAEVGSTGVLSAAAVVSQGSLPFTGFPLWGWC